MPARSELIKAVVLGNVAFDIICYPVDEVPRNTSMTFDHAVISPGGCGSNTAIGLAALGIPTALIACVGEDIPGDLAMQYWARYGVDVRFIKRIHRGSTGVSVGLVDHHGQPRFIHTTGTNQYVTLENIPVASMIDEGISFFHIAGFFLMPGILDLSLGEALRTLRAHNIRTTLDVQQTERLSSPDLLWHILGDLDIFMCNLQEAHQMLGADSEVAAAEELLSKGANAVIIKLGERGCFLSNGETQAYFHAPLKETVDTTGAGDAFAAGLIASLAAGEDIRTACQRANETGAAMVSTLGAVEAWNYFKPEWRLR
jgi:sugar/nucleoside kinase (ribokinase family)